MELRYNGVIYLIGLESIQAHKIIGSRENIKSLVEEFVIHVLLEISLVGIIDSFLRNTALSMLVGICVIEGFQFLWREYRG